MHRRPNDLVESVDRRFQRRSPDWLDVAAALLVSVLGSFVGVGLALLFRAMMPN